MTVRTAIAAVAGTALVLVLVLHAWAALVVLLVVYVAWTYVRIPLERGRRLRQIDPGWHRGRRYHQDGSVRDA